MYCKIIYYSVNQNPTVVNDVYSRVENDPSEVLPVLSNDSELPDVNEVLAVTAVSGLTCSDGRYELRGIECTIASSCIFLTPKIKRVESIFCTNFHFLKFGQK